MAVLMLSIVQLSTICTLHRKFQLDAMFSSAKTLGDLSWSLKIVQNSQTVHKVNPSKIVDNFGLLQLKSFHVMVKPSWLY